MADRLSELARQRALLSEHLAWLDREIANETVKRLAPAAPHSPAAPVPSAGPPVVAAPGLANVPANPETSAGAVSPPPAIPLPEATDILEQYRVTPTSVKQDVRKGCLLYFAAAFILLGIVVVVLYLTISSHAVE